MSLSKPVSIWSFFIIAGVICLFLFSCQGSKTPTPSPDFPSTSTYTPELPINTPAAFLPIISTPTPICVNNLLFIKDVTIPDGTAFAPGTALDKQWLVQNNGNCNWEARYRLRCISGNALGAAIEQALFPARAGTQANLRILFTAPQESGEYVSEWQAFDANGLPFGESFFIKIVVQQ